MWDFVNRRRECSDSIRVWILYWFRIWREKRKKGGFDIGFRLNIHFSVDHSWRFESVTSSSASAWGKSANTGKSVVVTRNHAHASYGRWAPVSVACNTNATTARSAVHRDIRLRSSSDVREQKLKKKKQYSHIEKIYFKLNPLKYQILKVKINVVENLQNVDLNENKNINFGNSSWKRSSNIVR